MSHASRRGFTLIELLVIVLIIAVLAALVFPAPRRVREASARINCQNKLKQLILALHTYADTHPSRALPPGCVGPGAAPEARLSWMVPLLPYLEQDALYKKVDLTKSYAENHAARVPLRVFVCPSTQATGDPVAHYVALAGIGYDAPARPHEAAGNGFMGFDRATKFDWITDGTANTLALIETRVGIGPWAGGGAANVRGFHVDDAPHFGEARAFGWHEGGGANAAFADGSVRFLSAKTDPAKLAAAITLAGNETITLD